MMSNPDFSLLTESERQCLRLALTRNGSKDIAPLVGLTHHTVDKRFKSAIRKLGAPTRFDAARMFAEYERSQRRPAPWDQSSDRPDQPPDVARPHFAAMMGGSAEGAVANRGFPAGGVREEQLRFLIPEPPRISGLRLPLRRPGEGSNALGVWQRLGWVFGVTLLLVVAFGFLTTGLMSLGRIATNVAHQTRN